MKAFREMIAAGVVACTVTGGCQPWRQLNDNTIGQGGSVAPLLERLVVQNLVLFNANPDAIPSQIAVTAGTVTTVDTESISTNDPFTLSVTKAVAATTAVTTAMGSHTATPSLNNQQNQNWTIQTITAPDMLDRLTALYRYPTAPGADLCREYPLVLIAAGPPSNDSDVSSGDAVAWTAATQADVIESYEAYKETIPKGQHVTAASLREAQIRKAPSADDSDENDWANAVKSDSITSYATYLKNHKNGNYANMALGRLRNLMAAAVPKRKASPTFVPDESLLLEPDCVKCSRKANLGNGSALGPARGVGFCPGSRDIYVNQRLLARDWLAIAPVGTEVPPYFVSIGGSGGFNVYTNRPDAWHRFVLAIQQAMETGNGVAGGKVSPGGAGKASKSTTTFVLPAQAVPLLQ
jgi:hypothetical protein